MTDWPEIFAATAPEAAEEAPEPELDITAEIAALAKLDPAEYEVRRREAAKRLGMRAGMLDKLVARERVGSGEAEVAITERLDPWSDPVDGLALAEEMRERLRAHVIFGLDADADLAALWTLGSYFMDRWSLYPRLLIRSPTKACGKTTLLEVIEALAHRPLATANASPAALFRTIEAEQPTLLLDEADMWLRQSEELASILNSGHTRRTAVVLRAEERGGDYVPRKFSTWAAIAVAGIGGQRDTLESRSVVIELRRRLPSERLARKPADLFERLTPLRRRARRWADDVTEALGALDTDPPECGDDRMRDNFAPLFRLAALLGGPWPERVLAGYLSKVEREEAEEPAGVMLLRDMAAHMRSTGRDRIGTRELLEHLLTLDDRPWPEWNRGRAISTRGVAKLLRHFGVTPKTVRLDDGSTPKGYLLGEVEKALAPYTPPPKTPQRHIVENKGKNADPIRHTEGACGGYETGKTLIDQRCGVVADTTGGVGADEGSAAPSGASSGGASDAKTERIHRVLRAIHAGSRSAEALAAHFEIPRERAERMIAWLCARQLAEVGGNGALLVAPRGQVEIGLMPAEEPGGRL